MNRGLTRKYGSVCEVPPVRKCLKSRGGLPNVSRRVQSGPFSTAPWVGYFFSSQQSAFSFLPFSYRGKLAIFMPDDAAIQKLVVPREDAGKRLDQWLTSHLPDVSRVRIQQLIEQSKITVNGSAPKPSLRLRGHEEIQITGTVELPPLKAFPEDIPLDVVYEDESLAVINKPAGMSVHAGSGKEEAGNKGTLVNALLHHFNQLSQIGGELRPGIVHRLDKETSGLIVVAKTDKAHRKLAQQFARRETKKIYLALVHGWMLQPHGAITTPISRDLVRRQR